MTQLTGFLFVGVALAAGGYLVTVLDRFFAAGISGAPRGVGLLAAPIRSVALALTQRRTITERPDREGWALAPTMLMGLAAIAFATVPLAPGLVVVDIPVGIVLFGAALLQVMVAVFLHGWGSNSVFPMVGAYRFAAMVFSMGIPYSLALLTTALPAESLEVGAIIESQAGLWNVIRQPIGLPVYLVTALGFAFWGPFQHPDAADVAGGSQGETSGVARLTWRVARAGILVSAAAMGSAAFLGGHHGPWLPGWLWSVIKTAALLAFLLWVGHHVARPRMENVVKIGWLLLLPLVLVNVFVSGWLLL